MSASAWNTNRDIATGFIQSVASRLGFPQRTIATAQQIYQRFHLFYPPSDFVLHELAIAALFVAAKLNDTHKKPRDLLLASYALRYPQLVKGSEGPLPLAGTKRKHPETSSPPKSLGQAIGSVAEADVDPSIIETDRKRLMQLEKLILESLCFNFHSSAQSALKMVIKVGRRCGLPKSFVRSSWKVGADMFRTTAPMQYGPNVVAVAALYAAALLARPPPRSALPPHEEGKEEEVVDASDPIVAFLNNIRAVSSTTAPKEGSKTGEAAGKVPLAEAFPGCDQESNVYVEDVEEAVHELLDLYLGCAGQLPPSIYMSPNSAATPSPLSPADPLEAFNVSPSSSSPSDTPQGNAARRKLKQYEYSPPPFGLVDWLNSARCSQLSSLPPSKSAGASKDLTAPTKEFSALLTDLKIYLRGLEYDRQKSDDTYLAEVGVVAEVKVEPMPAQVAFDGVGAHSVAIQLKPLNDTQLGRQARGAVPDPIAHLSKTQRATVERIRRRKLVSALRVTFVEPEIEKRPSLFSTAAPQKPIDPPSAPEAKRNRIEQAKRYLF